MKLIFALTMVSISWCAFAQSSQALSKQMLDKRQAIVSQAERLSQASKSSEAISLYTGAIIANPDLPGLRTRRAFLIAGSPTGNLESAKADALADIALGKKQMDDAKSLAASYGALATYYQKKEQWQNMLDAANESIKLFPNNCGAYSFRAFAEHGLGQLVAMKVDAGKMEQFASKSSFEDCYTLATTFFNLELFSKALVYENKAIAMAPNLSLKKLLETIRLSTLVQMNALDAAMMQASAMLSVDQNNGDLLEMQGQILQRQNKDEEALASYTAAIKQNPNKGSTYKMRGDLYLKIIEEDRALDDYTRALKLDPTDWHCYAARARLYEQQKKYRLAIADATQSMKFGPQIRQRIEKLLELRGSSKLELHMYKDALADFEQAKKLSTESARIQSLIDLAKKGVH